MSFCFHLCMELDEDGVTGGAILSLGLVVAIRSGDAAQVCVNPYTCNPHPEFPLSFRGYERRWTLRKEASAHSAERAMVAQISLCASSSPMCCRVTPVDVDLSAKEAGRPPERMPPPPGRAEETGTWAPWGVLVYTAYAGSAVAYFYVRCVYTLDLGALRWCAPAWFCVGLA